MRKWIVIATLIGLIIVVTLIGAARVPSKNFEYFKPLAAGIQQTTALTVFVGIPRKGFSPETDAKAKSEREIKTITLFNHKFYEQSHAAGATELAQLKALCCDPANFSTWIGPKACGGFHPDYCLEWKEGGKVYHVLLCFTCDEVKIYGPGPDLYCNANDKALDAMSEILKKVTAGK